MTSSVTISPRLTAVADGIRPPSDVARIATGLLSLTIEAARPAQSFSR